MSGGTNLLPKFMPISFFGRVSRFWGVSGCLAILECWPVLSLHGLKLCKLASRSDLVLDADHALDFLFYLVMQACISLVFQTKWCISVFRIKMSLLIGIYICVSIYIYANESDYGMHFANPEVKWRDAFFCFSGPQNFIKDSFPALVLCRSPQESTPNNGLNKGARASNWTEKSALIELQVRSLYVPVARPVV